MSKTIWANFLDKVISKGMVAWADISKPVPINCWLKGETTPVLTSNFMLTTGISLPLRILYENAKICMCTNIFVFWFQMKGLIFLHSIGRGINEFFSPSIFVKEQKNNFGGKDILQISCTRSKRWKIVERRWVTDLSYEVMYKDIPWNPLNFDIFLPRRQKRGLYNGQRTMGEAIGLAKFAKS